VSFWETLWVGFWWIVWAFAFIAYLMVLFNILFDIFRDHALKGWAKAIWVIFLVFVPFLTALVYLIARGNGMAERGAAQAKAQRDAADTYIRNVAGSSPTDEIEKASKLLAAGQISADEFARLKAKALS